MYLPGFYRSKIVNEVRNTHFEIGHSKPEFCTTNSFSFKGKPGTRTQESPKQHVSHVQLSTEQKHLQTSEFLSKFKSYTEHSQISPVLPTPNLTVGSSLGTYVTTTGNTYQKHQAIEKFVGSKGKNMRKHNFELGSGEKVRYQSEHQREHDLKNESYVAATDKEIKGKYCKSIETEGKNSAFVPTSYQDFKKRTGERNEKVAEIKKNLQETHINHCDYNKELSTTAQVFYSPKRLESNSLPNHKLKDLKSSHLNFGSSPSHYVLSSNHGNESSPSASPTIKIVKNPASPSCISFGDDKFKGKSDYSANFQDRPKSELRAKVERKYDNYSSVVLGEHQHPLTTQTQISFKSNSNSQSPSRLPKSTEKSLRTHHFRLGNDGNNCNRTTADDYSSPGKVEKLGNTKDSQTRMLESHWGFGKYKSHIRSEVQQEYLWRGSSERKCLNKSELRKSHFQIGDDRSQWQSNYKRNYEWIQPVADTNYKISLMK